MVQRFKGYAVQCLRLRLGVQKFNNSSKASPFNGTTCRSKVQQLFDHTVHRILNTEHRTPNTGYRLPFNPSFQGSKASPFNGTTCHSKVQLVNSASLHFLSSLGIAQASLALHSLLRKLLIANCSLFIQLRCIFCRRSA